MSFTYKIVEKICFSLDRNMNGIIKKQMHKNFLYPKEVTGLPKCIYRRFAVCQVDYKGHSVFIIRKRNKRSPIV